MTKSGALGALCRKLNINLATIASNKLFNYTDLEEYLRAGMQAAWDYYVWAFAEGDWKATVGGEEYYDYPDDCEDESIQLLYVGGKEFHRLEYSDYCRTLVEYPNCRERIFANHNRYYFINNLACSAGDEILLFGKRRAPVLSADADLLPFSPSSDGQQTSGNDAIVRLAYAEALGSEKLKNYTQAEMERKGAYTTLDLLKNQTAARRAQDQRTRPFFTQLPDLFKR